MDSKNRLNGIHPKHPQAKLAMWLAHYLDGAHPDQITRALIVSECPRRLFVLAATLRKAKGTHHAPLRYARPRGTHHAPQ